MATYIVADIYACAEHFYVKTNLAFNPTADLSRQFLHYSEIRDMQQFNNEDNTGTDSNFTGEIYTYFSNGDQEPPFDLENQDVLDNLPNPGVDNLGINFYPKNALVGAVPTVLTSNKAFYEALITAMGADNAAIVF